MSRLLKYRPLHLLGAILWITAVVAISLPSRSLNRFQQVALTGTQRNIGDSHPDSLLQLKGLFSNLKGTDFRGTVGNVLTGAIDAIAPESCVGQLLNTGYTNDLLGEDDYNYQPSCYNGGSENSISCFPSNALVLTPEGRQQLSKIQKGSLIATTFIENQYGEATPHYEPVAFFLHSDPDGQPAQWIRIEWKSINSHYGGTLTLTPDHLIFMCTALNIAEENLCQPVAVKRITLEAYISVVTPIGRELAKVTQIEILDAMKTGIRGLYSPATIADTIIVDGVLVSPFSTLPGLPKSLDSKIHYMGHKFVQMMVHSLRGSPTFSEVTETILNCLRSLTNFVISASYIFIRSPNNLFCVTPSKATQSLAALV